MPAADTRPFSAFEWMLAARYLRARRKEGFISVIAGFSFLGIMLGVATLIIVMAVMNGFRGELLAKILGFNGHATVFPVREEVIVDFDAMAGRLAALPGVTSAVPYVEGQVMASSQRAATGALVRGLRERDLRALPSVVNDKLRGTIAGFDGQDGIAVGWRLAGKHGLNLGDKVALVSPRGPVTPFGVTPRIRAFPVAAIFNIGMSEYDNVVVFMPLAEAQEYFAQETDGATAVELMVDKPDAVDTYLPALQQAAGPGTQIITWKKTNQAFFNALQVERNVMFLILTLIILVAALNIVSGLIMLVKDKGRDIAILRTMGATRGAVMRIFLITGAAIGGVGTLAGFLLGVVVCANIETIRQFVSSLSGSDVFSPELYYLSRLPADMDSRETAAVVAMSLVLAFGATLYPSWRAARLDPVEALRYE